MFERTHRKYSSQIKFNFKMQFAIPYSILEIPNSSGVISFSINYKKKFLACLTEKSIQLFDNSGYFPILITSYTQFFDSFNVKGPNNWIEWITDEDLAFVTQNGMVFISHIVISERKQPIHDYDNDFYKRYLNRFEFIKILAPIQVSIFDQNSEQTESHPYVTTVYNAYNHICIGTSESKIIYISKDTQITHSTQFFTKPGCIFNALYYPPSSLFLTYDNNPYFINYDLPSFQNQTQPIIEKLPIKNPTLLAINYQQTYLAVFKGKKGTLRIFQLGLSEWKPPITVYSSQNPVDKQTQDKNIEQKKPQGDNNDSINDPVIHIFWNSKGNTLIIIHRSGKTAYFFLESKTLHKSKIDYFEQHQPKQENQQQQQTSTENAKSNIPETTQKVSTNEITYKFLFDLYGERLFVTNGSTVFFITLIQNRNFFIFTSSWISDLRRSINLYNDTSLYPIRDISLDFNNEICLISNDRGFQLIDNNSAKIISDFIPVVSESNKKNRVLLNAHFISDKICVCVGPIDMYSDDKFELNFSENPSNKSEVDCDNSFYQQFDCVYKYEEIYKKEQLNEKLGPQIDDGDEIKSLILLFSIEHKASSEDGNIKYEVKPDLLVKSYFVPKFFDYIEDHGILADDKNIAYINIMNELYHPNRISTYFLTKSQKIFAVNINKINHKIKIRNVAMSTSKTACLLMSDDLIYDEKLKPFGEDMFVTKDNTPIYFDVLASTKTPPAIFYIYNSRIIEGRSYKSAFYSAIPIFSVFGIFLRVLEIPFAFDGMIFYIVPEKLEFGRFVFKFMKIGQHVLIESLKNYGIATYLVNFVYRKFKQIPVVVCETLKEVLHQNYLPQTIMILFPHFTLEEIAQIIQFLPTRTDKQAFSKIFAAIFNYISYSNKNYTPENKKYEEVIINNQKFSSKIIKLEWNKIFSLIDKNIRNHIFANIAPTTFICLLNEINLEISNEKDANAAKSKSIFDDELIQFLMENGEIIRAYSIANKENSTHFCELFKKSLFSNKPKDIQENLFEALNLIEKEKKQWNSIDQMYPIAFHFLGCLFQVEGLSLFSAATFIIIGEKNKFQAVIISDESIKNIIEKYLNENLEGIYVNEIREAIEAINN